jgi:hypothetical protein
MNELFEQGPLRTIPNDPIGQSWELLRLLRYGSDCILNPFFFHQATCGGNLHRLSREQASGPEAKFAHIQAREMNGNPLWVPAQVNHPLPKELTIGKAIIDVGEQLLVNAIAPLLEITADIMPPKHDQELGSWVE